jgi:hypothetical protein
MSYRLTPQIEDKVLHFIRAGGYDWVAAEAAGVPRAVFSEWLARGERSRRQPYHRFSNAVMVARAQARLKAEVELRSKCPRDWLRMGPGRETPDRPGWSVPVRPVTDQKQKVSLLDLPDFQRFADKFFELAPAFPGLQEQMRGIFGTSGSERGERGT